jgi:DNA polymerase-4
MLEKLADIAAELELGLRKSNIKGRTLTLKIKHHDFTVHSKSKTVLFFIENAQQMMALTEEMLANYRVEKPIRLLGLSLSKLNTEEKNQVQYTQLTLNF